MNKCIVYKNNTKATLYIDAKFRVRIQENNYPNDIEIT